MKHASAVHHPLFSVAPTPTLAISIKDMFLPMSRDQEGEMTAHD
jgi:hypothetical protein